MQKILLVFLILFFKAGYSQTPAFTIESNIRHFDSETYSLTVWGRGKSESMGRQQPINGQIYYKDTSSVPLMIRITPGASRLVKRAKRGYYPVKSQSIWLVAMPGSTVRLNGHLSDFSEVYPEGDTENKILQKLTKAYFPLINKAINITVLLNQEDNGLIREEVEAKKKEQKQLNEKAEKILVSFLKKHPSSIAGLYFLGDTYIRKGVDINLVEKLLKKVKPSYHDYQFYTEIKMRVEASKFIVGSPMMEVRSNLTPDGTVFSTGQWKGKFYLIDFWGSWCGPCITDFPNLKELKSDLKERIEILGIASDQEKNWRSAIKSYELDWQHILIGEGDQDFASLLDVKGYPTKILVDPEGNILYRSTGSGKESFDKMRELIMNWKP